MTDAFRAKPDDADRMARTVVDGTVFHVRVAGVVRDERGRVLAERGELVELVGGRLNVGELAAASLARELQEELDVVAHVGRLLWIVEHQVVASVGPVHELLLVFDVACDVAKVRNAEGQELVWLDAEGLSTLHPAALQAPLRGEPPDHPVHLAT